MPGLFPLGIDPTSSGSSSAPSTSTGLVIRPHRVRVYPPVAQKTGNVRTMPTEGASVQVWCQVGAMKASAAFEQTGRELSNPYYLLCNLEDAATFALGSRVTLTTKGITKLFTVEAKAQTHFADITGSTDHGLVVLEERDYAS